MEGPALGLALQGPRAGKPGRMWGKKVNSMTLRQRFAQVIQILFLAFILVATGFLSAVTAVRFAIRGKQVEVPSLVGLPVDQARGKLRTMGVRLEIGDRVYSEQPANTVIWQLPSPGTQIKLNRTIHVSVSLGPRKFTIPGVEGQSLRAARIILLQSGLNLGSVAQVHLPGSQPDQVVRQQPPPQAPDATDPRVNLLVSLGPPPVELVMPDLIGRLQLEGELILTRAGLKVGDIVPVRGSGRPRRTIIASDPQAGAKAAHGSAINLQVAE